MSRKPISSTCSLFLLLFFSIACQPGDRNGVFIDEGDRVEGLLIGHDLALELAFTDRTRERGLMFREHMDENHGMLFLFEHPQRLSFWMRNTRIPLDIGYFDADGVLREIHALYPFDETPVPSRSNRMQFALEVNRGWFERNGVTAGAELDLAKLTKALVLLDGNPDNFSLNR